MIQRLLNLLVLLVWATFLGLLLTYGKNDLIRLIHPRLWWVIGLAVVVLILFSISLITSFSKKNQHTSLLFELPSVLILLVPIVYFSLAREARLDGGALQDRLSQAGNGLYRSTLPSSGMFDGWNSEDLSFSKILQQPSKYENKEVEVVCQSFVNDTLPENTAMCYRYMITCCAADALPVFVFLKHQSDLKIDGDRWVKVNGVLSIIQNDDIEFLSVEVDKLEYVEEPAFPWAM